MFPHTSLKFLLTAVTSAWARTNNVPDFYDYKCNFCIPLPQYHAWRPNRDPAFTTTHPPPGAISPF